MNQGDKGRLPRIVLTGGPGAGKSTASDFIQMECEGRIAVVPEAATILWKNTSIPRTSDPKATEATQRSIFQMQHNLENLHDVLFSDRVIICDRGTVDGPAYWPDSPESFFTAMGTTYDAELDRYDAVVFFESAAVGGLSTGGITRNRNENEAEAVALDSKLRGIWEKHPRFILIPHQVSFLDKINLAISTIKDLIDELAPSPS